MKKNIVQKICLQVQTCAVINGFSYPFTKCLVGRLKEMMEKKGVFQDGEPEDETINYKLSPEAEPVVCYLAEQVKRTEPVRTLREIKELILVAENFLSIFEE